jgi:beta-lactamase class A
MNSLTKTPLRALSTASCLIAIGIIIGFWVIPHDSHEAKPAVGDIRQAENAGRLTNQLLECAELPEGLSIGGRINLEQEIREKMDALKQEGKLTQGAVYYRDLNNGPWFGINEDTLYYPASLLKVPLAMAFYSRDQENPGFLQESAVFESTGQDFEAAQAFGSPKRLEDGKEYSIEELVMSMLQDSSNEAALILAQIAGEENVLDVYEDIGIPAPQFGKDYQISVHTFGSFFRILFNATYLDRIHSEKMLEVMTHSGFTQGIAAGLPSEITVAHKFGTREVGGVRQLHDCGIVYAPEKPYILCVMTQGTDYDMLADFIKDVSETVFKTVTS